MSKFTSFQLEVQKAREVPLIKYEDSEEEKAEQTSEEYTEASESEHD